MNLDPIIKERLLGVANILNTMELDPEMWDPNNSIWQNTNNHVMLMLRKYYDENETDPEIKAFLGPVIDHLVWLYVIAPEIRARVGWMTWFIIVYVTDNQFKKETGQMGLQPEPWTDPRSWALAKECVNPITTVLIPNDPNESKGPT